MRPALLAFGFFAAIVSTSAETQVSPIAVTHPELIEGPWEATSASGIEGISFQIDNRYVDKSIRQVEVMRNGLRAVKVVREGEPKIELVEQRVRIVIYHRGQGRNGKLSLEEHYDPRWFVEHFDGRHLHVRPVLPHNLPSPALGGVFELNVTLASDAKAWTGTFARDREVMHLTFERPHPAAGARPTSAVGDWAAVTTPARGIPPEPHTSGGSLHIRQSSDGVLMAWLDRPSGTQGTPLTVTFTPPASLQLVDEVRSCMGGAAGDCIGTFRGTITGDRNTISGSWQRFTDDGQQHRPEVFHRLQLGTR